MLLESFSEDLFWIWKLGCTRAETRHGLANGCLNDSLTVAPCFSRHARNLPLSASVVGIGLAADFEENRFASLCAKAHLRQDSALHSIMCLRFGVSFVLHYA